VISTVGRRRYDKGILINLGWSPEAHPSKRKLKMWRSSLLSGIGPDACLLDLWTLPKVLKLLRLAHHQVLDSMILVILHSTVEMPSLLMRYLTYVTLVLIRILVAVDQF
jgi:hypothetical protein